jgi:hypothetical protein
MVDLVVNNPGLPQPQLYAHPPVNFDEDGEPLVPLNGGAREYTAADALLDLMSRVGNRRRQTESFLFKLYQDAMGAPELNVPAATAIEMISFPAVVEEANEHTSSADEKVEFNATD